VGGEGDQRGEGTDKRKEERSTEHEWRKDEEK
jgi:hypothetical protein